ncbi:MAG: hypothetical protein EOP37_13150 [Rubrivivax sp.]|nr:MAG: hypothetical protein EOP37_13150 [Rubrivivax sp.]
MTDQTWRSSSTGEHRVKSMRSICRRWSDDDMIDVVAAGSDSDVDAAPEAIAAMGWEEPGITMTGALGARKLWIDLL